jgi:hypothetical protein
VLGSTSSVLATVLSVLAAGVGLEALAEVVSPPHAANERTIAAARTAAKIFFFIFILLCRCVYE